MKKAKDQPESDMNAAYVGHIERGVQNPTLNTLERICKGLDISVEDLFIDKSATVDMNTAALQYFSQITRDLSPEQFHRLLNIIKEIVVVGGQTGFVPGLCSERHDALCGTVPRRVQRRTAAPCAAQHPPGRYLSHRAGRPRKAARMEKVRFPHLHRLQRQVQKRRAADEILIFTGIPPIYTRGIRKPQMPLVTY